MLFMGRWDFLRTTGWPQHEPLPRLRKIPRRADENVLSFFAGRSPAALRSDRSAEDRASLTSPKSWASAGRRFTPGCKSCRKWAKRIANNRRVLAGIRIESAGAVAGAVRMLNAKRGWRRPQSTFWMRTALVVPPTRTYGGRTSSRCGWLRS